eukprot:m.135440 g.135440  ORF g.135440 m.135440 type:complete len:124 (-) comp15847_c1_seq2:1582-1953(-)
MGITEAQPCPLPVFLKGLGAVSSKAPLPLKLSALAGALGGSVDQPPPWQAIEGRLRTGVFVGLPSALSEQELELLKNEYDAICQSSNYSELLSRQVDLMLHSFDPVIFTSATADDTISIHSQN